MTNFDAEQFYPTPPEAIEKMLDRFTRLSYRGEPQLSSKLARPFIDPHGGNGDLLDALVARGVRLKDCFAYEINPTRRATLQGKGYRVLGADFIEHWENLNFGTWLINPPWRQDAKHLMTCYRRMRGGHMIALMSTANFENPRTADEMAWANLVAQLQAKGQAEVENFGSIFMDSERKTKAECTCIWLNLPVESVFDPSQFETEAVTEDKTFDSADLVSARFIPAIVAQYRAASRALEDRHLAQAKLNHYFWLKVHKSGTVHIWFKNKDLLKKFNHAAAAQKKWIDSYEAESCADQREREKSRQPAEHVEVHYPKHDGPGQLALI